MAEDQEKSISRIGPRAITRREALGGGAALVLSACAKTRATSGVKGRSPEAVTDGRPLDRSAAAQAGLVDASDGGPGAADAAATATGKPVNVTMFRGNPSHTFYGTGPISDGLVEKWRFKMGSFLSKATAHREEKRWSGTGWTGTAVFVDGRVFIGSQDSRLYCIDAGSGKEIWRYQGGRMFKSSACYHEGRIFIGNVDDHLHCVDADTGKGIWRWNSGQDLDSSACIYDGRLYIGGEAGYVTCMVPASGKIIWRRFLGGLEGGGGSGGVESSPAVVDGRVYASNYSGVLYCMDALTGKDLWRARTYDDTDVSPVVAKGRVWTAAQEKAPYVYSFDAVTGKRHWRFRNNVGWWSTPALVGDRLFIGGDFRLYCLHAFSGAPLWAYKTGAAVWSSPAVVDGKVIFGSYDRHLYLLDARDGSLLWREKLDGRILSSPCVVAGHVYIGTATGWFYAFGPREAGA